MWKSALTAILAIGLAAAAAAGEIASSVDADALAKRKQTALGLYLTPADAHKALQASPEIVFLDVRDPVEISFVGHAAPVDAIAPLRIATHEFDAKRGRYKMAANPNFLAEAETAIARNGGGKDAPVFIICRSGSRSAGAANILAKAGYTNVWNIVEGFEGDMDKATGSRSVNGWRNAGLPWRYRILASVGWSPME